MKNSVQAKSSPIEVWLRQPNLAVTCDVVFDDETSEQLDIDSLSMMGAQREITAYLIDHGYAPVGRWEARARTDGKAVEVSRKFKVSSDQRATVAAS